MDKLLFVSMNGAKNSMRELEILTNNLANVNTTGFRADATMSTPFKVKTGDNQSRVYAKMDKVFTDFKTGPMITTRRDLDVAVSGPGFIAVQSASGKEGYTRAGDLELGEDGILKTHGGHLVMGNSGIINLPNVTKIEISGDGTISGLFPGAPDLVPLDKIKLVNPDVKEMAKGKDGLFYSNKGSSLDSDSNVNILTGTLEGSNVNAIEVMTKIIDISRSYEMHTNFMKTMAENAIKSNQILNSQS